MVKTPISLTKKKLLYTILQFDLGFYLPFYRHESYVRNYCKSEHFVLKTVGAVFKGLTLHISDNHLQITEIMIYGISSIARNLPF